MTSHEVDGLTRIGVDVGGTFTDLIFYDARTGEVRVAKEPTTPAAPDAGVISAVAAAVSGTELEAAEYFLHGTTVGLNALLERRGGQVGLLATARLPRRPRDAPRRRRGALQPLLASSRTRSCRDACACRSRSACGPTATVHVPFEPDEVTEALRALPGRRRRGIAVAFLNAYANPATSSQPRRRCDEAGFEGEISLSHRVSGEYREYERTSTTVIDAYVRPRTSKYLGRLEDQLRRAGVRRLAAGDAVRRRRDDVRRGARAAVRDDPLRPGRRRRGRRRARARARPGAT